MNNLIEQLRQHYFIAESNSGNDGSIVLNSFQDFMNGVLGKFGEAAPAVVCSNSIIFVFF